MNALTSVDGTADKPLAEAPGAPGYAPGGGSAAGEASVGGASGGATFALRNARLVLEDTLVHGSLSVVDGRIAAIDDGPSAVGEDVGGDYVLPGLIELHTDHLETHYMPRPGVRWPVAAAVQSHDAQIASAGITTVLDCLRLGRDGEDKFELGEMRLLADALRHAEERGALRAEHRLHLRCEVSTPDVLEGFEDFLGDEHVRLVSLMDHAPGQRQFASPEAAAIYYQGTLGLGEAAFAAFVDERTRNSRIYADAHRAALAERCREGGIALASHDDASVEHVDEANGFGVTIAEFPTTHEAAARARAIGMHVLMGAPNVVRGGSHSGNVSALALAEAGLLDLLSSDYVPFSLLQAVFHLAESVPTMDLPRALRCVSASPAALLGLEDRGRIADGLRADLVRVSRADADSVPVVRTVWRAGRRVA